MLHVGLVGLGGLVGLPDSHGKIELHDAPVQRFGISSGGNGGNKPVVWPEPTGHARCQEKVVFSGLENADSIQIPLIADSYVCRTPLDRLHITCSFQIHSETSRQARHPAQSTPAHVWELAHVTSRHGPVTDLLAPPLRWLYSKCMTYPDLL